MVLTIAIGVLRVQLDRRDIETKMRLRPGSEPTGFRQCQPYALNIGICDKRAVEILMLSCSCTASNGKSGSLRMPALPDPLRERARKGTRLMAKEKPLSTYEVHLPAGDGQPPKVVHVEADHMVSYEEPDGLHLKFWVGEEKVFEAKPALAFQKTMSSG